MLRVDGYLSELLGLTKIPSKTKLFLENTRAVYNNNTCLTTKKGWRNDNTYNNEYMCSLEQYLIVFITIKMSNVSCNRKEVCTFLRCT